MGIREGFVSNSSSCSFLLRLDGFKGAGLRIDDLKTKYIPLSDEAEDMLTMNQKEGIYIALWKLLTSENPSDFKGVRDVTEGLPKGWKEAVEFSAGQDAIIDQRVMDDYTSYHMGRMCYNLFRQDNVIRLISET